MKKLTLTIKAVALSLTLFSFINPPYVFNIPALKGKSIREVNRILGKPTDETKPTAQQIKMGVTGDEDFAKNGYTLQIEYNPKSGKVLNMFLGQEHSVKGIDILLRAGNLYKYNGFRIIPVRQNTDPSKYTGITILDK